MWLPVHAACACDARLLIDSLDEGASDSLAAQSVLRRPAGPAGRMLPGTEIDDVDCLSEETYDATESSTLKRRLL
jgi:hypothetical protein